ncbi:YihY/virulence factor BrkB family protein [Pseudonocardia charpentierae]|uniref:YihY/virulence factor BrkB family protein n=1 Tax=Pseudonocardia charpentierae TaxID=3075545 RepID=A0ABU2N5Z5_9PSEU|nr:YihY/virulence factor BrkB family protein [Pseudonocardia sp. DSM 45834]MDT0349356.1 YihY/virulence factor BrkB family protein [Pseudonocardia sp. DSM 45834]
MTATGAGDRREADGPLEQDAAPGPATRAAGARRVGRELVRGIGRSYPDSDLALWAAGATFFGIIGVVPIVLVSLRLAAALVGADVLTEGVAAAVAGIPQGHGTPVALRTLTATALQMSPLQTAIVLFPASLYGEGLRRAFLQLSPASPNKFTGWSGRLALLPIVAVAPVLVLALLAAGPVVSPLYIAGGSKLVLGVVIAFHVTFVLLWIALLLLYRLVGAGRVGTRALVLGSFAAGSVIAGFLQGFLLFLAIPVDWSLPFGGLPVFGAVAALALWLYLIHVLVLVGYRLTLTLDAHWGPGP